MKKLAILFLLMSFFSSSQIAYAGIQIGGYKCGDIPLYDQGEIYSGVKYPTDVAKSEEVQPIDLDKLSTGESSATNILGLVETGDASIEAAARQGGIKKVHYVDTKINKIYIPLGFIPIYVKEIKTIVYGETEENL